MSLCISFEEFEKMVEKECQKQTGMSLADFPNIYCEDFWPVRLNEKISVQTSKNSVEVCINSIIENLGNM